LVIFKELIDQDDSNKTVIILKTFRVPIGKRYEFKPPPPESSIGWRVEFRSMEIQLTDLKRSIRHLHCIGNSSHSSYDLNFYLPISKVDENMKYAHCRDAVNKNKFWFRTNIFNSTVNGTDGHFQDAADGHTNNCALMKIINGKQDVFIGLVPLIRSIAKHEH